MSDYDGSYQSDPYQQSQSAWGQQDQPTQVQSTQVQSTRAQPPQVGYGAQVPPSGDYGGAGGFGGANGPVEPRSYPPASGSGSSGAKKAVGTVKSLLMGLLGGVVGSLAVALVLNLTGFFGGATSDSGVAALTDGSGATSATQAISITASDDTTVAEAVAAKCLPSVVSVNVTTDSVVGLGSGVILDTEGNIITNSHVVEGATEISVTIGDKTYPAELVGADDSSDIAVVKADLGGDTVTPIEVGDSDALAVGEWVMTIGSPYGLDQSVSTGVVSALSRSTTLAGTSGTRIYGSLIQVDANINSGNSGGALVNSQGQLVGINTLFESTSGAFAGIGFSISGNYAISIANKIISGERVTHAYIGLSMLTVNEQNSQGLPVSEGAYVAEVPADGPADQAGIEAGDIVVQIDDTKITSADDVIVAVRGYEEGDVVTVVVNRDGEELSFEVTLGNDEQLQIQQQLQSQQTQEQQDQDYPQGTSPYDDFYQQFFDELFGQGR